MPRASTKKPKTKAPKGPELAPTDSNGAESAAVAIAVAEPPADELQPPTTPVETHEPDKADARPAAEKDKDHIATTPVNIAKLQAMSMGELNQMARELAVE